MRLRSLPFVALLALLAQHVAAQVPDPKSRGPTATVSGVIRDSIAHMPLVGALVQIVSADSVPMFANSAFSDSRGRFTIENVPNGRFHLGFFHPVLDSLGVQPPLRDVSVVRNRSARVNLVTPSAAQLRAAYCGPWSMPDSGAGAVVIGVVRFVRDAQQDVPAAGVKVSGEWLELTFRAEGVDRRRPHRIVTTAANGMFVMCNVPNGGTMFLTASSGADSTDLIDVQVPTNGFLRRDLYLGAAQSVVVGDGTPRTDTLAAPPRRLRVGGGLLHGTVVTADGTRPLIGALVRIADGQTARTNDHGEWTLVDAPTGTRMLEVRAMGYYPEHRPVDIVAGAAPVTVALSTFQTVLSKLKVTTAAAQLAERRNRLRSFGSECQFDMSFNIVRGFGQPGVTNNDVGTWSWSGVDEDRGISLLMFTPRPANFGTCSIW